jgi:hypothetical protein
MRILRHTLRGICVPLAAFLSHFDFVLGAKITLLSMDDPDTANTVNREGL